MTSCRPEQVIITSGAQQALDLVARVLVSPGEALWIEDPGSVRVRRLFKAAGASLIPVPVDAEGIMLSEGVRAAPDARLAYVTPTHQYPLGVSLSLSRRLALVEWAASGRGWIIERDFESEYRFGARSTASVQGLDTKGRTVFVGSFSKVMFPALRLGYLVAPDELLASLLSALRRNGSQPPTMQQVILAEFIDGGHFATHVRRTRTVYARRRSALAEALQRDLNGKAEIQTPEGGLRLVVRLPAHVDDRAVSTIAGEQGIEVLSLSSHSQLPTKPGLLLGFARADEDTLRTTAARLARILDSAL
jgi:GntR family transcriptional regulator/MocR family aminotransferase